MREFKFKVFDKRRNKLFKNGICVGSGVNGFYIIDADDRNYENEPYWIYEKDVTNNRKEEDFIVMQNTGLKDVNGTEIYEGDIVRLHFEYHRNKPVIIKNICDIYKYELNEKCEIIGNIYENKELAKCLDQ